jgi:hypothetical protein
MRLPFPLAVALAALSLPCSALAWSEPGHRIVGELAELRMGPAARRFVREQVGALSLSDRGIALWADDVRDRRTGPWHYVNVPRDAERCEPRRDCPAAGCAVSALEEAVGALRRETDPGRLVEALRWLVHLTADLHQPMHAGELRDRGGNDTTLRLGRRKQPLDAHRLWDAEVVEPIVKGGDALGAARALTATLRPADAAAWSAELSPAAWATESHLAARAIYRELGTYPVEGEVILLPSGYPASQRERVVEALTKAGVRLAALLDRIATEREARRPPGSAPLPR